uniref:Uncharacterized protein n=1 Tax=Panagrolaimus sp. PS1159 TaxID=55785 RepID=A0AC35EVZ7_9BILA
MNNKPGYESAGVHIGGKNYGTVIDKTAVNKDDEQKNDNLLDHSKSSAAGAIGGGGEEQQKSGETLVGKVVGAVSDFITGNNESANDPSNSQNGSVDVRVGGSKKGAGVDIKGDNNGKVTNS